HIDKKWHFTGIRIEDDVLVTKTGHDVLSKAAPKEVDEIEALMAEAK
ncbi:MAG: Xaa-Pro aminopeptidase, partial [Methylophagaceae bacterium]